MKLVIVLVLVLMCSVSFGLDLTLENMQGGSEELVKFRKIDEGEAFSFNVVKSDPTDLATIRIFNTPKGSQFQNGVFSWTPGTDQSGMYNVSFSVVDTATQQPSYSTIRIVVADTHFDIPQNQLFEYLFTATDPDGDPVMITVTDLPAGATFVGGQFTPKLFSWRPSKQQKGNHQMTITATDAPVNGGVPKQDISIIYIKVGKPGGPSAKDDQLKKKKPAPKSRGGHSYRVTFKTISLEQMHEFAREWVNG